MSTSREERKLRWIVRLGTMLVRLLALTWRIEIRHDAGWRAVRAAGRPVIFSLWHGQMLPPLWTHRGEGVAILISEHRDGEIIARIGKALGHATVRGSTTRGGGRALVSLVRTLNEGRDIAVTPDGPKGPAGKYAPGALVAAQRANAPIIAIGVEASRAWRLRSWDRFMIPKPFAKVVVAYCEPVWVEADSPREAAAEAERFEALMAQAGARARA